MNLRQILSVCVIVFGSASSFSADGKINSLSDAEIRKEIVLQSIASYRGNCPCPEYRDRAGRWCGRRSAYSRPGGQAPLCYESDVTPEMVIRYKKGQLH